MDSDPSPDWITSVVRPFDDNPELQLAARQELGPTSPENLGMGRLEVDSARTLQSRLLRALDAKPQP